MASKMAKFNKKPSGTKTGFPKGIDPMLATLVDEPVEQPGWLYEIKWDGYRAIALINKGKVNLLSRNNKSFNDKFYSIYQTLRSWKINVVLDGEVVVLNENGVANFGSLQNWRSEADGQLIYYVFDILWLNGYNLKDIPLSERKKILKQNLPFGDQIRYSESFDTNPSEFLAAASKMGMEGIMAKKADSHYIEGERTRDWLKIKAHQRQEVVIGGFTNNEDSSKLFSSLLVGVYEKGKLHYIGKIGTGFNDKIQQELFSKMRKLISKEVPFVETPDVNAP